VTTGSDGIATSYWKLGTSAGTNTVTASCSSCSPTSVTFTATAVSGNTLVIQAGNNQTGTVGQALSTLPQVLVRNPSNAPLSGITVNWAIASGGGTINSSTTATSVTNASGLATPPSSWVLGSTSGTQTLSATVSGITTIPQTVTFAATANPGAPATLTKSAGDNQSGPAGSPVATVPAVLVRDSFNNPVPNVTVTFSVTSGGGSVSGASATTNSSGIASPTSWTLGTTPGTNTLNASVSGLTPVTFTATGTVAPATMNANNATTQTAPAGTQTSVPPSVIVRSGSGAGVAGVTVTFTITAGGGSIIGPNTVVTNSSGVATVGGWTLGSTPGTNTMTASIPQTGVTGNPVTFTATGTDPCATFTTFVIPSSVNGSLTSSDCVSSNQAVDKYRTVLNSASIFHLQYSSSSYAPLLGTNLGVTFSGTTSAPVSWVFYVPSGTYDWDVTGDGTGLLGTYTFSSSTTVPTGCPNRFLVKGIDVTNIPLNSTSSCSYTGSSIGAAGTRNMDFFWVRLPVGESITVEMQAAFDTALELKRGSCTTGTLVASNDDIATGTNSNSRLTFTAPSGQTSTLYSICATTFTAGASGTYRLIVGN
jgi:hypothetical protein